MHKLLVSLFLLFVVVPSVSFAQDSDSAEGITSEWGVHVGSFLPDQIPGLTEILPMSGLRYGWASKSKRSFFELGAFGGNGSGTSFYGLEASLRGDITLRDLTGIFYIGPDFIYYLPPNETRFQSGSGGHIGTGLITKMGGNAWFRIDMKFDFNPGTALHICFGIMFRDKGGEGGGGQ